MCLKHGSFHSRLVLTTYLIVLKIEFAIPMLSREVKGHKNVLYSWKVQNTNVLRRSENVKPLKGSSTKETNS